MEVAEHRFGMDEKFGMDEIVQDFERSVREGGENEQGVQIVGIVGYGGIGKTTLAKELYNRKRSSIHCSSFLFDVRGAASKNVLHLKQKKLLTDCCNQNEYFDNVKEGKALIADRLRDLCVLVVLDDVDHEDQIDALLPPKESIGRGSVVIITTREMSVLTRWGITSVYKAKPLQHLPAKALFCWHAFLRHSPPPDFNDLVDSFVEACSGLPLLLKVIGRQLYVTSSREYWCSQLNKIQRRLPSVISNILKESYDALDYEEQEAFLDIACFFIGETKSRAIDKWDASGWSGLRLWEALQNKCLVDCSGEFIRMHDHLRDLGRQIAETGTESTERERETFRATGRFGERETQVFHRSSSSDPQLGDGYVPQLGPTRTSAQTSDVNNEFGALLINWGFLQFVFACYEFFMLNRPSILPFADLASKFNWGALLFVLGSYGLVLSDPLFWMCWTILIVKSVIYNTIQTYWKWIECFELDGTTRLNTRGAHILMIGMRTALIILSTALIILLSRTQGIAEIQNSTLLIIAASLILFEGVTPVLIGAYASSLRSNPLGNIPGSQKLKWGKVLIFIISSALNAVITTTGPIVLAGDLGRLMQKQAFWGFAFIFMVDIFAQVFPGIVGEEISPFLSPKTNNYVIMLRLIIEGCLCWWMGKVIYEQSYFPSNLVIDDCNKLCRERSKHLLITMVALGGLQAIGAFINCSLCCLSSPRQGRPNHQRTSSKNMGNDLSNV